MGLHLDVILWYESVLPVLLGLVPVLVLLSVENLYNAAGQTTTQPHNQQRSHKTHNMLLYRTLCLHPLVPKGQQL